MKGKILASIAMMGCSVMMVAHADDMPGSSVNVTDTGGSLQVAPTGSSPVSGQQPQGMMPGGGTMPTQPQQMQMPSNQGQMQQQMPQQMQMPANNIGK